MKKITLLGSMLLTITVATGQITNDITINELLERQNSIPTNGGSVYDYYTPQELETIRSHFANQENANTRTTQASNFYGHDSDVAAIVTFDVANASVLNFLNNNSGSSDFEGAGDIDPNDLNTGYSLTLTNGNFFEIDIATGIYTLLGVITPPNAEQWNGLEFDQATGILYGISSNFFDSSTLSTIDIGSLVATPIGQTGAAGMIAIAIDQDGAMYGHDVVDDAIYTIDIDSGVATYLADLDFNANFGQDLEWDQASETLYMTSFDGSNFIGELRTVDRTTGATTVISTLGDAGNQVPWSAGQNALLATENTTITTLEVFPNPAKNQITVNGILIDSQIEIVNLLGQKTLSQPITSSNNLVDVSQLSPGIYIATLSNKDGKSFSTKLVKK